MTLDYRAIGQRIRSSRLRRELTQEVLAELTNLSNQHISNIETGSTKLSLQTLVKIANVLDTSVDELLCDSIRNVKSVYDGEIMRELKDCNEQEIRFIADTVKCLKKTLRYRLGTNK